MGGAVTHPAAVDNAHDIIRRTSLKDQNVRSSLKSKFSDLHTGDSLKSDKSANSLRSDGRRSSASTNTVASGFLSLPAMHQRGLGFDDAKAKYKFNALGGFEDNIKLDKKNVIVLAKWVLRLSGDVSRRDDILSMFNNCLRQEDDTNGLSFDEFCMMYEEIATRVEMEQMFSRKFEELDTHKEGFISKSKTLKLTDFILLQFAQIWCTKREIIEMRKKIGSFFESLLGDTIVSLTPRNVVLCRVSHCSVL